MFRPDPNLDLTINTGPYPDMTFVIIRIQIRREHPDPQPGFITGREAYKKVPPLVVRPLRPILVVGRLVKDFFCGFPKSFTHTFFLEYF